MCVLSLYFPIPEENLKEYQAPLEWIHDLHFRLQVDLVIFFSSLSEPMYVKVANGEVTYLKKPSEDKVVTQWSSASSASSVRYTPATDEEDAKFTVGDEPGAQLPATGGLGTGIVYLSGILLITLAALSLLYTRCTCGS